MNDKNVKTGGETDIYGYCKILKAEINTLQATVKELEEEKRRKSACVNCYEKTELEHEIIHLKATAEEQAREIEKLKRYEKANHHTISKYETMVCERMNTIAELKAELAKAKS